MKKNLLILILFICINLAAFNKILAAGPSPIEKLDSLADQTLQLTKLGRFSDAVHILQLFESDFSEVSKTTDALTSEEITTIRNAEHEAEVVFQSDGANSAEIASKVTSFRLAVDAVQRDGTPLWTQMKEPILTTIEGAEQAIEANDLTRFNEQVTQLLALYHVISPSLEIDVSTLELKTLHQEVQFVDEYRGQVFLEKSSQDELENLRNEFDQIFREMEHTRSEPSILWVIAATSGIIVVTLSYVGWRKFKAEHLNSPSK